MWLVYLPAFALIPMAVIFYTFYQLYKMGIFRPRAVLGYRQDYRETRATMMATSVLSTFFARLIVIFLVM